MSVFFPRHRIFAVFICPCSSFSAHAGFGGPFIFSHEYNNIRIKLGDPVPSEIDLCQEISITDADAHRPRYNLSAARSEEHTSNSSHVKISYAVFCLKK